MEYIVPPIEIQMNYLNDKILYFIELSMCEYEFLLDNIPNNVRRYKFEYPNIYMYFFNFYVPVIIDGNYIKLICITNLKNFIYSERKLRKLVDYDEKKINTNLLYEICKYLHDDKFHSKLN